MIIKDRSRKQVNHVISGCLSQGVAAASDKRLENCNLAIGTEKRSTVMDHILVDVLLEMRSRN